MKKLLIATAAMAVVAGAQAQSSVTVYGIVDVNVTSQKNSGAAGTNSLVSENTLSTSRLGFKGTEDLGGGLKAEFQLESKLLASTGVAGGGYDATRTSLSTQLFNRESWVGLSSATLGSVRLGTTDLTDAANIDAVVSQAADLGINANEIGTDITKAVRYTTPTFAGFTAQVGFANPSATTTTENTTGTTTSTSSAASTGVVTSAFVKYEAGNLGLYAGTTEQKVEAAYDRKQTAYGAKYNFGVVSVGASYNVQDAATSATTASAGDLKQTRISVAAPLTAYVPGVTAHAVYFKNKSTGTTQNATDADGYKLALTKAFSKRTTGYVGFIDSDTTKAGEVDTKTYVVGVNHAF